MARPSLFTLWLAAGLKRKLKFKPYENCCIFFHKYSLLRNVQSETVEKSDDLDAEDVKQKILKAALNYVPEYGWSTKSLAEGAKSIGLSVASNSLIEGGGSELVHYFNSSCNIKLEQYLKEISSSKKENDVQCFLYDSLEKRFQMIIPYSSKWPEAMALMVLPTQMTTYTKNTLELSDIIWHYSGDKSVDLSWYTKRLSLAAAYKATELCLVQDKSPEFIDTFEFLHRRVENIIEAISTFKKISQNNSQLIEFGSGACITVWNLLGLNRRR